MINTSSDKNDIVLWPAKILRTKCSPVTYDSTVKLIAESMLKTMKKHNGVGLSAPQIGLPHTYFVCNADGMDLVFINPEIEPYGGWAEALEGCLSLPGVEVVVKRAKKCKVKAQDIDGNKFEIDADGLLARVIQHEGDHLQGITIDTKMGLADKMANKKKIEGLERFKNKNKIG